MYDLTVHLQDADSTIELYNVSCETNQSTAGAVRGDVNDRIKPNFDKYL